MYFLSSFREALRVGPVALAGLGFRVRFRVRVKVRVRHKSLPTPLPLPRGTHSSETILVGKSQRP